MKKGLFLVVVLMLAMLGTTAAKNSVPQLPRILSNARFVYVTAYDGDQFDPQLLPDDRAAISRVQDAIGKWGKLTLVYRPQDADVILAVQSRPTEDVLAVYDARAGMSSTYLWRVMGRGGLQKSETPLMAQFEKAWDKIIN
jgi:hypothetical protein